MVLGGYCALGVADSSAVRSCEGSFRGNQQHHGPPGYEDFLCRPLEVCAEGSGIEGLQCSRGGSTVMAKWVMAKWVMVTTQA